MTQKYKQRVKWKSTGKWWRILYMSYVTSTSFLYFYKCSIHVNLFLFLFQSLSCPAVPSPSTTQWNNFSLVGAVAISMYHTISGGLSYPRLRLKYKHKEITKRISMRRWIFSDASRNCGNQACKRMTKISSASPQSVSYTPPLKQKDELPP